MSAYTNPTADDFQEYFVRDFPYGSTLDEVTDDDIERAIAEASISINPRLFSAQQSYTIAFLYLSAHQLVVNLQTSSQGIFGQGTWLQQSKAVAGVSEAFVIPQRIQNSPLFSALSKTRYGMKYLELLAPLLIGQAFVVPGRTQP